MLLYSDTIAPSILEAWAEVRAFTQSSGRRPVFEYAMHQYRTFNCKPFSLCTTCGWIPLSLLALALICVTHGSGQAWQQGITPYRSVISTWFLQCCVCILYAASTEYSAPGKRGAQQWVSVSPHALHMSHGDACALYICISCVFAAQTSLFLDITSNCSVGLA